jgi:hypothetical protein
MSFANAYPPRCPNLFIAAAMPNWLTYVFGVLLVLILAALVSSFYW